MPPEFFWKRRKAWQWWEGQLGGMFVRVAFENGGQSWVVVKIKQAGPNSAGLGGRAAEHREKSTLAPMPGCWNLIWETASDTAVTGQSGWDREPP